MSEQFHDTIFSFKHKCEKYLIFLHHYFKVSQSPFYRAAQTERFSASMKDGLYETLFSQTLDGNSQSTPFYIFREQSL